VQDLKHSHARAIQGELDELEREEFFRLKKVQAKKKRDMEAKEAEAAASSVASAAAYEAPSLLDERKDDDLLF
jgi:V-type H+-transporting ATPase subunit D